MIDRKPHKKCKHCGRFLPVDKFYPRSIKKSNGVVYRTIEPVCKICRSRMRIDKIKEEIKRQPNTL